MSDKQPTISKKELIETCGYISQTRLNQWLTWLTTPDMQIVIIPYRYTPKNGKIALQQAEWMRTEHNNSKTRYIVDACAEKLARDDAGNSVLLFEQLVVHTGKPLTLTEIRRQLKCQNIRLSRHMLQDLLSMEKAAGDHRLYIIPPLQGGTEARAAYNSASLDLKVQANGIHSYTLAAVVEKIILSSEEAQ